MTEPIDLLDEASWFLAGDAADIWLLDGWLDTSRTVGDLRRLLAMAREAERLRGLLEREHGHSLTSPPIWPACADVHAEAALEGTDR